MKYKEYLNWFKENEDFIIDNKPNVVLAHLMIMLYMTTKIFKEKAFKSLNKEGHISDIVSSVEVLKNEYK